MGVFKPPIGTIDADTLNGYSSTHFATPDDIELFNFKGIIDCSTNPNFPSATVGDIYKVSKSGLIGGVSGAVVTANDSLYCNTSTESGDYATVGINWDIVPADNSYAVIGPTSSINENIVIFDGTDGIHLKDSGSNVSDFATTSHSHNQVVGITSIIDGGGSAIQSSTSFGFLDIPFDCTITGWTLLADQSGTISIDIKKCNYSEFPTNTSIVGSLNPGITSSNKASSENLTGWTTAISANDILEFYVDSADTIERVTLTLKATRSI